MQMQGYRCVYVNTGAGLGRDPDPERVAELNLPTLEAAGLQPRASGNQTDQRAAEERVAGTKEGESQDAPFIIGEALPVVPGKLVRKIVRGEFVDMAELLKDNLEMERRRLAGGESWQGQRPSRREVPDFESWLQCFSAYAAVVGSRYPQKCRELWAYQAMMISEHRKCGGRGWLLYDSAFRQQIASLESTDFSKINQGLYSTTFLAYGGRGQFCARCMMSDHSQDDCALHPSRTLPMVQFRDAMMAGPSRREEVEPRRKPRSRGACYAFNDGKCSSPYCRFEHICSRCGGNHRKSACRARARDGPSGRELAPAAGARQMP